MEGVGDFSENFDLGLGDFMTADDGGGGGGPDPQVPQPKPKKSEPFPSIEGNETLQEFITKYKKAVLNRRSVFRDLQERWTAAGLDEKKKLVCFETYESVVSFFAFTLSFVRPVAMFSASPRKINPIAQGRMESFERCAQWLVCLRNFFVDGSTQVSFWLYWLVNYKNGCQKMP